METCWNFWPEGKWKKRKKEVKKKGLCNEGRLSHVWELMVLILMMRIFGSNTIQTYNYVHNEASGRQFWIFQTKNTFLFLLHKCHLWPLTPERKSIYWYHYLFFSIYTEIYVQIISQENCFYSDNLILFWLLLINYNALIKSPLGRSLSHFHFGKCWQMSCFFFLFFL